MINAINQGKLKTYPVDIVNWESLGQVVKAIDDILVLVLY